LPSHVHNLYRYGEGDKWELYIPYDLAYGEHGSPPKIPPFSPLVFEIEVGLHKLNEVDP
jgi:FKBP-type peptidyl-prolyl cis-trans isomerase